MSNHPVPPKVPPQIEKVTEQVESALKEGDGVGAAQIAGAGVGAEVGRTVGGVIGQTAGGPVGEIVGETIGGAVGGLLGGEAAKKGVDHVKKEISEEVFGPNHVEERKIRRADRRLMKHFRKHPDEHEIRDEYVSKMTMAKERRDLGIEIGEEPSEASKMYCETARAAQKSAREQILAKWQARQKPIKMPGESHLEEMELSVAA